MQYEAARLPEAVKTFDPHCQSVDRRRFTRASLTDDGLTCLVCLALTTGLPLHLRGR